MLSLRQLFVNRTRPIMHIKGVRPTNTFRLTGILPVPIANSLAVRYTFNALTDKDADTYTTLMVFHGIKMTTEGEDSEHPLGFDLPNGHEVFTSRPSYNNTPTGVNCSCLSYYFLCSFYNNQNTQNHAGDAAPLYPNYDPNYFPHVNRGQLPTICKHLAHMAFDLMDNGILLR